MAVLFDMSISRLQRMSSLVVLVLLAINAWVTVYLVQRIGNGAERLAAVEEPLEDAIQDMEIHAGKILHAVLDYVSDPDTETAVRISNESDNLNASLSAFERIAVSDDQEEFSRQLLALFDEFGELADDVVEITNRRASAVRSFSTTTRHADDLLDNSLKPSAANEADSLQSYERLDESIAETVNIVRTYMDSAGPDLRQNMAGWEANFSHYLANLRAASLSVEQRLWLDEVDNEFAAAIELGRQVLALTDNLSTKLRALEAEMESIDSTVHADMYPQIELAATDVRSDARRSRTIAIILLIVMTLVIPIVVAAFGRKAAVNLADTTQKLVDGAVEFGKGNLRHRVETEPQNELSMLASAYNDMAERRRFAERRFRNVIETVPVALVIINENNHIQFVNRRAEQYFGYSSEEFADLNADALLSAHGEITDLSLELGKAGRNSEEFSSIQEAHGHRRDGSVFPVVLELRPIRLDGQDMVLCTITDIEDRKKMEAHLRQQQKLESIGTLAGGVAHEINNPINGIMNYAQLIEDRLDNDNPLQVFADGIRTESERVAEIVRNLLSFSRQVDEPHQITKISDLVANTVTLVGTIIRRDHIVLNVDVPDDIPAIHCNPQQIRQVLMNLLINARDALNEHHSGYDENKQLNVSAEQFTRDEQQWVRVSVEDFGIGISEKDKDRIFDPFFTTKEINRGTGLGLSISYGIIDDHLGRLWFESEPLRFTRFHVELPTSQD